MPMLLKNLTFPPKLTAQNPQNAPSRAKNMGRLKIPVFLTPGRECMYCSILRAQVEKMDKISPKRRFSDKDEWASVLSRLQEQGKLTHQTDGNKIILEKDE